MNRGGIVAAAVAIACGACKPWATEDLDALGPAPVYTQLSGGVDRTCGLGAGGVAYCWGLAPLGSQSPAERCDQDPVPGLETPPLQCMTRPVKVAGDRRYVALVTGTETTLALDDAGNVWGWGFNNTGLLGDPDLDAERSTPVRVVGTGAWRFATIAAGRTTACGVTDGGRLVCWGQRNLVTAGVSVDAPCAEVHFRCVVAPTQIGSGTTWTGVAVGEEHACARDSTGAVYCWGNGARNQLGSYPVPVTCPGYYGNVACQLLPTRVSGTALFSSLVSADDETCGISTTGSLMCWGTGAVLASIPSVAAPGSNWAMVSTGGFISAGPAACAVKTDGTLWCFGPSLIGGNGPHQINLGAALVGVTVGDRQACTWSANGDAWCFGSTIFGQLGDGTSLRQTFRSTPVSVLLPFRD